MRKRNCQITFMQSSQLPPLFSSLLSDTTQTFSSIKIENLLIYCSQWWTLLHNYSVWFSPYISQECKTCFQIKSRQLEYVQFPQGQHPDSRNKHYVISLQARKRKTVQAIDRDQVHTLKIKNSLHRPAALGLLQYLCTKYREHLPTKHSFQHIIACLLGNATVICGFRIW
jgi:hypothetical protein